MIQRHLVSLLVLLLPFIQTTVWAAPPSLSPIDRVALTAWLQVPGGSMDGVIVEVEVDGQKDWGRPDEHGRLELQLPKDQVALIHFRKSGLLAKSIKVDTHNLQDGAYKGKRRSINFGVELEAMDACMGLAYAGPVGSIAFAPGTGNMAVETDLRLVPERQQSIVF